MAKPAAAAANIRIREETLNGFCAVLDGRSDKPLNWVSDSGVATLIPDSYGVEACHGRSCDGHGSYAYIPLHEPWPVQERGAISANYGIWRCSHAGRMPMAVPGSS